MKAVIMAGGEGSRLRPLTCDRPKPMVPILGKPMMEHIVKLLVKHNFYDVAVTLQYLPERIQDYFGSGEQYGVNFSYFVENEPLGTAGSVKNASSFLQDTFLVISGDCLTDIDLTAALQFHREKKAVATLVLTPVDNPLEYGVVITDAEGRIIRFLEKPGWGEVFSDTVNTGIYILEPGILDYFEDGKKFDFSKDLFPLLLEKGQPLYACSLSGFWCDVGNLEQYQQAQVDILNGMVNIEIPGEEKENGVWLAPGVQLEPGAQLIPPVYIGPESSICSGALIGDHSIIGAHNCIESSAVVKRGITWEGVTLAPGASLKGGILGQNASLGEKAAVYEGAVVGDKCLLEEKCEIKPQVKVWPYKRLASGTIQKDNLVWGSSMGSFFGFNGIKARLNQDLTPEVASGLGAAFGSLLGSGEKVIIGCDPCHISKIFKDAVKLGLLSTGLKVIELIDATSSMTRLGITYYKARGGVHLNQLMKEPGYHRINFFDEEGFNISRGDERKIEQLYARDDFSRVPPEKMKKEERVANLEAKYKEHVLREINTEMIKKRGFKIVLCCHHDYACSFLLTLLGELKSTVFLLHAPLNAPREERESQTTRLLKGAIQAFDADLGAVVGADDDDFLVISPQGDIINKEKLQVLLNLFNLRHRRLPSVVVPVTASRIHEELARRYHGKIIRSKTSPRHQLEAIKQNGVNQLPVNFDTVRALLDLLDFFAVKEQSLDELLLEVPSYNLLEKEVPCSWEEKGRVMRQLVEEAPGKEVEMIDGLKVYHPEGWALILPDPEKPSYRIYSEGNTEEIAESLTDFYLDRVKELQQKGDI